MMSIFGWSLPAGVSTLPGEEPYYCSICGTVDFVEPDAETWPADLPGIEDYCSVQCAKAALAGFHRKSKEDGSVGEWLHEDGRPATDPYGHITWSIGSGEDFICFDHCVIGNLVILESVVNSETSSFIDTFGYEEVERENALDTAWLMVNSALEWCSINDNIDPNSDDYGNQSDAWIEQLNADLESS